RPTPGTPRSEGVFAQDRPPGLTPNAAPEVDRVEAVPLPGQAHEPRAVAHSQRAEVGGQFDRTPDDLRQREGARRHERAAEELEPPRGKPLQAGDGQVAEDDRGLRRTESHQALLDPAADPIVLDAVDDVVPDVGHDRAGLGRPPPRERVPETGLEDAGQRAAEGQAPAAVRAAVAVRREHLESTAGPRLLERDDERQAPGEVAGPERDQPRGHGTWRAARSVR